MPFRPEAAMLAGLALVVASAAANAQPTGGQTSPKTPATQSSTVTLPPPQPSGTPTPSVSAYRINPGDELEIYVWGEERLQRELRVLPDGTIAFPLVGQLRVQGLLPQEVERQVADRLRGQYRGDVPSITVSVRSPAGMQFSVMGKVRTPGSYVAGRYINLLDALSLAGGPAEFANLDSVLIIHQQDGRLVTSRAKLGGIFKAGANAADVNRAGIVRIEPGDVVIVP